MFQFLDVVNYIMERCSLRQAVTATKPTSIIMWSSRYSDFADDELSYSVESLYADDSNEAFYFIDIKKEYHEETMQTLITFNFGHLNRRLDASVVFDGVVPEELDHVVFCIGMCVLPWYWMGFGCRRIIIERKVYSKSKEGVLEFWQQLYSNVLLEYLYSNASAVAPVIEMQVDESDVASPKPMIGTHESSPTLVPIGCKYNCNC